MADLPAVPEEQVERPRGNMFGKMLSAYKSAKWSALHDAKQAMFDRHKVTRSNENKYKLVEDRVVLPSGKEVIELRLYELIDGCAITITANADHQLEGGINQLREFRPYEPPKN